MSRSQKQYLLDILTAMDDARRFIEDLTFEELEGDQRTQYALQRTSKSSGRPPSKSPIQFGSVILTFRGERWRG